MALATNLQPLAYAVAYVTFFLGTTSTFLRFYSRYVDESLRKWRRDDYFAVVVFIFSVAQQGVLHMFLYWGCGLHMDALNTFQQLEIVKWLFVEEIVYYSVHWVMKSAFLFFYLRLARESAEFSYAVYAGLGLNTIVWGCNMLLACIQCMPFDEILHPGTHPDAYCMNKLIVLLVPCLLNIGLDMYILLLPIAMLWNCQISFRKKIAVLSVLTFGSISVIIATFRLIPLLELGSQSDEPIDTSWVLGKMIIIAALETQFAIVAVNLPSLKKLCTNFTGEESLVEEPQNLRWKAKKLTSQCSDDSDDDEFYVSGGNGRGYHWRKSKASSHTSFRTSIAPSFATDEESLQASVAVALPVLWVKSNVQTRSLFEDVWQTGVEATRE
ncbi:uncharacterized protein J4E88_002170 [Alternaria novae-zelandiae]|uniref:uncharacterized protein n=1 Tax=Alternaria novae-zelandiae TaxID=430562 RepID=UPI0020C292B6|nr:uncharacterized protein J4E88_002170 [Alternaria novae-zelandiae]KAI4690698.1 hypothetical protein J4E88_002170 [Alternaria novae-zelandiae]